MIINSVLFVGLQCVVSSFAENGALFSKFKNTLFSPYGKIFFVMWNFFSTFAKRKKNANDTSFQINPLINR